MGNRERHARNTNVELLVRRKEPSWTILQNICPTINRRIFRVCGLELSLQAYLPKVNANTLKASPVDQISWIPLKGGAAWGLVFFLDQP